MSLPIPGESVFNLLPVATWKSKKRARKCHPDKDGGNNKEIQKKCRERSTLLESVDGEAVKPGTLEAHKGKALTWRRSNIFVRPGRGDLRAGSKIYGLVRVILSTLCMQIDGSCA